MDEAAVSALLAAATAGCAPALAQRLMLEVTDAAGLSGDPERDTTLRSSASLRSTRADDAMRAAAALQMMAAAAPRDPLEAMLAAQMAAAHSAAMRAMGRAAECTEYRKVEALYARQASRLMDLFTRQTEALERRRERAAKRQAAVAVERDADEVRPARPPRPRKRPKRANGRCNGALPPRNGRGQTVNGTGPPT